MKKLNLSIFCLLLISTNIIHPLKPLTAAKRNYLKTQLHAENAATLFAEYTGGTEYYQQLLKDEGGGPQEPSHADIDTYLKTAKSQTAVNTYYTSDPTALAYAKSTDVYKALPKTTPGSTSKGDTQLQQEYNNLLAKYNATAVSKLEKLMDLSSLNTDSKQAIALAAVQELAHAMKNDTDLENIKEIFGHLEAAVENNDWSNYQTKLKELQVNNSKVVTVDNALNIQPLSRRSYSLGRLGHKKAAHKKTKKARRWA